MGNDKYKRGSVLVHEEAFLHESGRFAIFFMMGRAGVGVLYLPSGEVITKNLSDMTEAEYLIEELLLIIAHLDKCDFSKPDFAPDADTAEICNCTYTANLFSDGVLICRNPYSKPL